MSQITSCPSCATSFKVVADQLRVSDGWVRCGQCHQVFDALASLALVEAPALLPADDLAIGGALPDALKPEPQPQTLEGAGSEVGSAAQSSPWDRVVSRRPMAAELSADALAAAVELSVPVPAIEDRQEPTRTDAQASPPTPEPLAELPGAPLPATAAPEAGAAPELSLVPQNGSATAARPNLWEAAYSPTPAAQGQGVNGAADARSVAQTGVYQWEPVQSAEPNRSSALRTVQADSRGGVAAGQLNSAMPASLAVPGVASTDGITQEPVDTLSMNALGDADTEMASARESLSAHALHAQESGDEKALPSSVAEAARTSRDASNSSDSRKDDRADDAGDEQDDPEVSFVVHARRKAFWHRPGVRWSLFLITVLAAVALLFQMLLHERNRLAAFDVRLKPWLMQLCAPLGCSVLEQRQIADIVIDSSSFNKVRGDSYLLNFTMKSQASIALAMPAIELTLTDSQDQPVLRRVLLPGDMAAPARLPAQGEWAGSVSLLVTTGGSRIAGYRLLAFYP